MSMDYGKRYLPARNRKRNPIYYDSEVFEEKKKTKSRKSSRKIVYRSDDEEIVSKENRYGLTSATNSLYRKVAPSKFDRWNRSVLTERNSNLPSYSEVRLKPVAKLSNNAGLGSDDKSRARSENDSCIVKNNRLVPETPNNRRAFKTRITTLPQRHAFRLRNGFTYDRLLNDDHYCSPDFLAGRTKVASKDYTITRIEWMTVCRQLRNWRGQDVPTIRFGKKIGQRLNNGTNKSSTVTSSLVATFFSRRNSRLSCGNLFGAVNNRGRYIVRISLERPICRIRYASADDDRKEQTERVGNRIFKVRKSETHFELGTAAGGRSLSDRPKSPIVDPKERLAQTIVQLKRILEHKRVEVQKFRFLNDTAEYSLRYRTVLPDDLNVKYAISVVTLNAINDDLAQTYGSLRSSVNDFISFDNSNETAVNAELSVESRANELVERHRTKLPLSSAARQEGPILKLVRNLTGVMLRLKHSGEANGKSEHSERSEKLACAMNRIKDALSSSNAATFDSCVQKPIMTIQRIVSGTLAD